MPHYDRPGPARLSVGHRSGVPGGHHRPLRRARLRRVDGLRATRGRRGHGARPSTTRPRWPGWRRRSTGISRSCRDRLIELGVDPQEAMAPFRRALEDFHAQTAPSDWLEGLVKAYVGDGIGTDFYREISNFVDEDSRALVVSVCDDMGQSAFIVERVRAAINADPRAGGRLALWGRRLVGRGAVAGAARGGRARRAVDAARRWRRPAGHGPRRDRSHARPADRQPRPPDGRAGTARPDCVRSRSPRGPWWWRRPRRRRSSRPAPARCGRGRRSGAAAPPAAMAASTAAMTSSDVSLLSSETLAGGVLNADLDLHSVRPSGSWCRRALRRSIVPWGRIIPTAADG